jgi:hypothetical protein
MLADQWPVAGRNRRQCRGPNGATLLTEAMASLNERERAILFERRLTDDPKTLEELSQTYNVSRERVRQIEVRAFEKLQKAMQKIARESQCWSQQPKFDWGGQTSAPISTAYPLRGHLGHLRSRSKHAPLLCRFVTGRGACFACL